MKRLSIHPEQLYSIIEIVNNGFFYWRRARPSVMRLVKADRDDKNYLKADIVRGKTINRKRYYIKGKNIIRFIHAFENGQAFSDPLLNTQKPYKKYKYGT